MLSSTVPGKNREKCVLASEASRTFVSDFVSLYQQRSSVETDKCLTSLLSELYGGSMARALKFLLDNVDEGVRQRFAYTYLSPQSLACHATATIVVRPASLRERVTPNMGRFLVYVRDVHGNDTLLRFASQVSAVFYLMFLIDRRHKTGDLPPIDLRKNEQVFCALYHAVYENIGCDTVEQRYRNLLYRKVDGHIRTGRKGEAVSDIRRQLERAFAPLGESFLPYAMTARSHLTVSPDKIVFEGLASRLLFLDFQ